PVPEPLPQLVRGTDVAQPEVGVQPLPPDPPRPDPVHQHAPARAPPRLVDALHVDRRGHLSITQILSLPPQRGPCQARRRSAAPRITRTRLGVERTAQTRPFLEVPSDEEGAPRGCLRPVLSSSRRRRRSPSPAARPATPGRAGPTRPPALCPSNRVPPKTSRRERSGRAASSSRPVSRGQAGNREEEEQGRSRQPARRLRTPPAPRPSTRALASVPPVSGFGGRLREHDTKARGREPGWRRSPSRPPACRWRPPACRHQAYERGGCLGAAESEGPQDHHAAQASDARAYELALDPGGADRLRERAARCPGCLAAISPPLGSVLGAWALGAWASLPALERTVGREAARKRALSPGRAVAEAPRTGWRRPLLLPAVGTLPAAGGRRSSQRAAGRGGRRSA